MGGRIPLVLLENNLTHPGLQFRRGVGTPRQPASVTPFTFRTMAGNKGTLWGRPFHPPSGGVHLPAPLASGSPTSEKISGRQLSNTLEPVVEYRSMWRGGFCGSMRGKALVPAGKVHQRQPRSARRFIPEGTTHAGRQRRGEGIKDWVTSRDTTRCICRARGKPGGRRGWVLR